MFLGSQPLLFQAIPANKHQVLTLLVSSKCYKRPEYCCFWIKKHWIKGVVGKIIHSEVFQRWCNAHKSEQIQLKIIVNLQSIHIQMEYCRLLE